MVDCGGKFRQSQSFCQFREMVQARLVVERYRGDAERFAAVESPDRRGKIPDRSGLEHFSRRRNEFDLGEPEAIRPQFERPEPHGRGSVRQEFQQLRFVAFHACCQM